MNVASVDLCVTTNFQRRLKRARNFEKGSEFAEFWENLIDYFNASPARYQKKGQITSFSVGMLYLLQMIEYLCVFVF